MGVHEEEIALQGEGSVVGQAVAALDIVGALGGGGNAVDRGGGCLRVASGEEAAGERDGDE
jgi:hypothetical protein